MTNLSVGALTGSTVQGHSRSGSGQNPSVEVAFNVCATHTDLSIGSVAGSAIEGK